MKQTLKQYEQHVLDGADILAEMLEDLQHLDPSDEAEHRQIMATMALGQVTASSMIAFSNLAAAAAIEENGVKGREELNKALKV